MPVRARAPAKLNLGLSLRARRPDGYHEIETIFLPLDLHDELEFELAPRPGVELEVEGVSGLDPGPDNLVQRAVRATCAALGVEPALRVRLTKRIPMGAGLGGGSSDAALSILALELLLERGLEPDRRAALALELGADVPFFLDPWPALGRGIGERLTPLPDVPEMHWLLVAFPFEVSTPWAYGEASRELTLPREGSSIGPLLGPAGVLSSPPNDLEAATCRRHPEVTEARRALERAGASVTGMSGSGPTVYGRFGDPDEVRRASREVGLPEGARAIEVRSPGSASSPSSSRRSESNGWWGVAKW